MFRNLFKERVCDECDGTCFVKPLYLPRPEWECAACGGTGMRQGNGWIAVLFVAAGLAIAGVVIYFGVN